jgi:hypothetical protein
LAKLKDSPQKYEALYNLLLDSGLRLVESRNLINNFKDAEEINGFFRWELGVFEELNGQIVFWKEKMCVLFVEETS